MRKGLIEYVWGQQRQFNRPLTAKELAPHLHCPVMSVHSTLMRLLSEVVGCPMPLEYAMIMDDQGVSTGNFVYWVTRPTLHKDQIK